MNSTKDEYRCPIDWCRSDFREHGEFGDEPDDYTHVSAPEPLGAFGNGCVIESGSGPIKYAFAINVEDELTSAQLRTFADASKNPRTEFIRRAAQVDQLNEDRTHATARAALKRTLCLVAGGEQS